MVDRYLSFTGTTPGRFLTRRLGLPQPAPLKRWSPEHPTLGGDLLHLTAGGSDLDLTATGLALTRSSERPAGVLLDATGVRDVEGLADVHTALHPVVRSVATSGRVVVLGAPLDAADHHQAAAQQALEGFVRSLGKEIGRGRTVNLVRSADALAAESTLRFLLSPKSAYVSGQVIEAGGRQVTAPDDWDLPWPAGPRWSPAPRAGSGRRSPRRWRGTGRGSSSWTYRRRRRTRGGSPNGSAAPRSPSTSRRRTRASGSPPPCPTAWTS